MAAMRPVADADRSACARGGSDECAVFQDQVEHRGLRLHDPRNAMILWKYWLTIMLILL